MGEPDEVQAGTRRSRPKLGRVTLEDVAAAANVSPATVSRVVRHSTLVAKPTRERVRRAVEQLGYIPDLVAGSLASDRTGQVAVVIPSFDTPAFVGTLHGIAEFLQPRGYQCVLGDNSLAGYNETALLTLLLGRRVDAVILADVAQSRAVRTLLRRSRVPVVETWTMTRHPIDMNVGFDNRAAARDATRHLIATGRRRIGMICGPLYANERGRQRRHGFFDAIRAAGLADDLFVELAHHTGMRELSAALETLIGRAPGLDAVFCSGDNYALGALFAAQRRRWAVPGRLAIAGLGDLDLVEHSVPSISGARIPGYRMGRLAAEMVVRRLRGEAVEPRIVDVGYDIVARERTRQNLLTSVIPAARNADSSGISGRRYRTRGWRGGRAQNMKHTG